MAMFKIIRNINSIKCILIYSSNSSFLQNLHGSTVGDKKRITLSIIMF